MNEHTLQVFKRLREHPPERGADLHRTVPDLLLLRKLPLKCPDVTAGLCGKLPGDLTQVVPLLRIAQIGKRASVQRNPPRRRRRRSPARCRGRSRSPRRSARTAPGRSRLRLRPRDDILLNGLRQIDERGGESGDADAQTLVFLRLLPGGEQLFAGDVDELQMQPPFAEVGLPSRSNPSGF